MTQVETEQVLRTALEKFEACLETPLVPGEVVDWSSSLREACTEALSQVREAITVTHRAQLKQIKKQDDELSSRVEQLLAEDQEILQQCDTVCQHIAAMCDRANLIEQDEGRFEKVINDIVEAGIAAVIRVRTQEQAIRTWHQEAFARDRGAGD